MNEFSKARLTLFGWYMLISFLLLTAFTIVAFQAESQSFAQIDLMLSNRIQRPVVSALLEKKLSEFTGDFRERLLYLDVMLFLISTTASWFLSGKTLGPIEETVKKQQEFSADASHELRTPLTSIIMELEAIKRTQKRIPKELALSLSNIKDEALRMKHLINNLLTLVRNQPSQSGYEAVSLNSIAKEAFESLKNQVREKKLEYVFEENQKIMVWGDTEALLQALAIIFENAIKYTHTGKIAMRIDFDGKKMAKVEVEDTGVGISSNDISHIFDRFYRARTRTKIHGTGLGLAIAKKIIDDHNGKITAKSIVDEGSTFTVYLPLAS